MKVTIVTATYNSAATVRDTLVSVDAQTHGDIEHLIMDGLSRDETRDIVSAHPAAGRRLFSEADAGLYDAMNKGIARATGDIVGILNSDDFYSHPTVIEKVVRAFEKHRVDAVFADLVYVRPERPDNVVRYYSGADFRLSGFAAGCQPPHPTFFVKRECYERYGVFDTSYRIAADFELLARFLARHRVSYHYLPEVIVKMRTGGVSTRSLRSNLILNREIVRACAANGIATGTFKVYSKYLTKCLQLVRRPA